MKTQLFDYADMIGKTVSGLGTNSAKSNLAIAFTDDTFIMINCDADDCDVDASMGPVGIAVEPERPLNVMAYRAALVESGAISREELLEIEQRYHAEKEAKANQQQFETEQRERRMLQDLKAKYETP